MDSHEFDREVPEGLNRQADGAGNGNVDWVDGIPLTINIQRYARVLHRLRGSSGDLDEQSARTEYVDHEASWKSQKLITSSSFSRFFHHLSEPS